MTEEEIRDYVRRSLGHPRLKVELSDDEINDAIDLAKMWYSSFVGQCKTYVQNTAGRAEYDVPDDCEEVVDVCMPVQGDNLTEIYSWAGVPLSFDVLVNQIQTYGYGDILQMLSYREMGKRIISSDRDWSFDRPRRKLMISPVPDQGDRVMVVYLTNLIELARMKLREQWLVREYAYAMSMKTLAQIRGKYMDLPSATGTVMLNADTLSMTAKEMQDSLTEQIKKLVPPAGFFAG